MAITQQVSRLGTVENLPDGSTYDMLLVSVSDAFPVGLVTFKWEDTPRKITGVQKVAQFFMRVLFTQKGSDVINYTFGTNFPELAIGANRQTDDAQFMGAIATCIKDAEGQTRNLLAGRTKDLASQLDKIIIKGLNAEGETLSIYVQIITRAGETASVAIPFPQLDMKIANG